VTYLVRVEFEAKDLVLSIWKDEFAETYRWGGLCILTMHPQVAGRPMRLATLREFIAYARQFPNVWFATGTEVARAWQAQHEGEAATVTE
jgi:hypothetical protein